MSSPAPVNSSPPPPADTTSSNAVPPSQATTIIPPSPPTFVGSPPPPPPGPGNNTTLVALAVGIGIGGAVVLLFVGIFLCWYRRRKRRLAVSHGRKGDIGGLPQHWQQVAPPPTNNMTGMLPKPSPPPGIASNSYLSHMGNSAPPQFSMGSTLGSEKLLPHSSTGIELSSKTTFTYEELVLATGGFSESNLLGQGGFGYVHKGVLPNGQEVAVKKLKVGSGQGEREFQAEVETINRVHHKHLVSLVGYCTSGAQRLLVYEFVPNNTLEFHLHGVWRERFSSSLFHEKLVGLLV